MTDITQMIAEKGGKGFAIRKDFPHEHLLSDEWRGYRQRIMSDEFESADEDQGFFTAEGNLFIEKCLAYYREMYEVSEKKRKALDDLIQDWYHYDRWDSDGHECTFGGGFNDILWAIEPKETWSILHYISDFAKKRIEDLESYQKW